MCRNDAATQQYPFLATASAYRVAAALGCWGNLASLAILGVPFEPNMLQS